MSGSPGNTSSGAPGGRPPRNENADVTERHARGGTGHAGDTDASTAARPTRTGRNDSRPADPDAPTPRHEDNQ